MFVFRTEMFAIVAFDQTMETDFVPIKWIADNTKISDIGDIVKNKSLVKFYWPPFKSTAALSKAQSECIEPEVQWPTYIGRILATAGKVFT